MYLRDIAKSFFIACRLLSREVYFPVRAERICSRLPAGNLSLYGFTERRQCQAGQLEMLQAERNADNRDTQ